MAPAGRCDSQGVPRAPSASSGPRAVPRPAALPGLPHPTTAARPRCAAPPNRSHLRHRPVRLRQPPDRTARHQRGDPAMARARDHFLATGSYVPVRQVVARLAAAALPDRGAVGPVEAAGPTTRVTVERRDLAERSMPLSPGTTPRQQEGGRARTHDGMVRARDPMSSDSANTAGRHPGSSTVFPIVPLASIARCAAAAALSGKR
jgi:hypothetical protein